MKCHSSARWLNICNVQDHSCELHVWTSIIRKWWHLKTVQWHDSSAHGQQFPIICFMFSGSVLPSPCEPELYHWVIAAIKNRLLFKMKEGLLSRVSYPSFHLIPSSFTSFSCPPSLFYPLLFFLLFPCLHFTSWCTATRTVYQQQDKRPKRAVIDNSLWKWKSEQPTSWRLLPFVFILTWQKAHS